MTEDLQIKVGTKEEAAWTHIRDGAQKELEESLRSIIIGREIVKLAEKKIKDEFNKH